MLDASISACRRVCPCGCLADCRTVDRSFQASSDMPIGLLQAFFLFQKPRSSRSLEQPDVKHMPTDHMSG